MLDVTVLLAHGYGAYLAVSWVWGLGFGGWGLRFGVWGLGFGGWGFRGGAVGGPKEGQLDSTPMRYT